MPNFLNNSGGDFTPPDQWPQFKTVDLHTGGEPLRVILDGLPELEGSNVLEYRRFLRDHHDDIRKLLMFEPRGHADMYGCIITPPNDDEADFGVVFIHNEGYSTMCGHAVIALGKLAIEMGWVDSKGDNTPVIIDAPCGRIHAEVDTSGDGPTSTTFLGVPSFVFEGPQVIEVDSVGQVEFTLAYGGAFYAYVDAPSIGLSLVAENTAKIIDFGRKIKKAIIQKGVPIDHPFEDDLSFLYGTIFTGGEGSGEVWDRNVCVFADGEVDRSPTGSGVSGRMAIHYFNKDIQLNQEIEIESICGSVFRASVTSEQEYGPFKAVIPSVSGEAWITGINTFFLDPKDPFRNGFLLR